MNYLKVLTHPRFQELSEKTKNIIRQKAFSQLSSHPRFKLLSPEAQERVRNYIWGRTEEEIRAGKPPPKPTLWRKVWKALISPFVKTREERIAHAQNVYAIAKDISAKYDVDLDQAIRLVREKFDDIVEKEYGLLTPRRATEKIYTLTLPAFMAPTGLSIPSILRFTTLAGALRLGYSGIDMLIRKIHKQPAYFKWVSSPSELLPEEANQLARDTVDLLELFGLIWLSGKVKGLERRAFERLTKTTITEAKLPEKIYLTPEGLKQLSEEELKNLLVRDLKLNPEQIRTVLKQPTEIELPSEKVTYLVDRPWWAKIKNFFRITPTRTVISHVKGNPQVRERILPIPRIEETPTLTEEAYQKKLETYWKETSLWRKREIFNVPIEIPDEKVEAYIEEVSRIPLHPPEEARVRIEEIERKYFPVEKVKPKPVKSKKPKKVRRIKSLIALVRDLGGIDPKKAEIAGYPYQTFKEFGLISALKKGGLSPDEIAQELVNRGELVVPEGVSPSDALIEALKSKQKRRDFIEKQVEEEIRKEEEDEEFINYLKQHGTSPEEIRRAVIHELSLKDPEEQESLLKRRVFKTDGEAQKFADEIESQGGVTYWEFDDEGNPVIRYILPQDIGIPVRKASENYREKIFDIAQKAVNLYKKEIPSSIRDDVVQEVATRMLEKLPQWDKSKGKLETYLISAIKPQIPEIITNLTKVMRIPRPTQERLAAYNREVDKIRKEKGREPTEEEINAILKKLHISKETLEAATREIISLSQPVSGSEELVIEDMIKGKEQQNIVEDLIKKQIPSLIKRLPPLHQRVIELYFGFTPDGKTYTASQIAEFLNIPLNRVETLLTEALRKLADMEEIVTLKASRALEDLKYHAGVYLPHPYAEKIREVVLHLKGMIRDVFRGLVGKLKAGLRKKRTEKIINEISAQLTRTEEGFKDLRKELKMEIEKYTPQGYETLEEWAEAVKKMPEPTFIEFFSHAYATFSRLKIPEVARWISDAFFYSRFIADERANQFFALCEAIFGREEIPLKYHKKMRDVLERKEPVPEEWKMLVDWWSNLINEMHTEINEARKEIGLDPIGKVEHYLYRPLNDVARTYLDTMRILNGKAVIGDLPPEILQNIRFLPLRPTIPMLFERTIENPDQILEWINSERAKKGLPPLESIYETDPNKLILATIYAETRYPYLLRALRNIQERKKTLPPATQEFIDNWLKYQVLGRVHPIDRSINKAIEIVTKPLKAVGINLGKNPIAAITRFYGRALHFGVLGFNIPLAGLNALQLFHNVAINGFVSTMKAIEALVLGLNVKGYSPAWKLLKFSRIVRNRYPYELTVAADLTTLERMGALLYRSADFLNITTAFLGHLLTRYKLYPEFRNKVKPFIKDMVLIELTGKTRKLRGVEKILQGILEAAERGLIWDDLYKADYYAYIAQFPYEKPFMMPLVRSTPGQLATYLNTWNMFATTGFYWELFQRALKGKTSLGEPIPAWLRLGFLQWLLIYFLILSFLPKEKRRYYGRSLPHRVIVDFVRTIGGLSVPYQVLKTTAELASAWFRGDEKRVKMLWGQLKRMLRIHAPLGVVVLRDEKGREIQIKIKVPKFFIGL